MTFPGADFWYWSHFPGCTRIFPETVLNLRAWQHMDSWQGLDGAMVHNKSWSIPFFGESRTSSGATVLYLINSSKSSYSFYKLIEPNVALQSPTARSRSSSQGRFRKGSWTSPLPSPWLGSNMECVHCAHNECRYRYRLDTLFRHIVVLIGLGFETLLMFILNVERWSNVTNMTNMFENNAVIIQRGQAVNP